MDRTRRVLGLTCVTVIAACSIARPNEDPDVDVALTVEPRGKPKKDSGTDTGADTGADTGQDSGADTGADSGYGGASSPDFIDACSLPGMTRATFNATGTEDPNDEGVTSAIALPFSFTFFGTSQSHTWVTSNGQLGFGSTPGGSRFGQVTCPLPDSRFGATPTLLVYSVDLVVRPESEGGGVCYGTTGSAPNRKFVVTWKNAFFYEAWNQGYATFSTILHEGTNVAKVVLEHIDGSGFPDPSSVEAGGLAALGKQQGTSAVSFSCQQQLAPEGTVVTYNP